jgi:hypothetical protein
MAEPMRKAEGACQTSDMVAVSNTIVAQNCRFQNGIYDIFQSLTTILQFSPGSRTGAPVRCAVLDQAPPRLGRHFSAGHLGLE